jgi:SAM-dependent methyltransferase
MPDTLLPPAVAAFDAVADRFDERFGEWQSVAAQRRAVQRQLLAAFPVGSHILELAAGTAEDALFLAARGRRVMATDGSPAMVRQACRKAVAAGCTDRLHVRELLLEDIEAAVDQLSVAGSFDGAYSNFAGLNCVADLRPVARGLAQLLPAGAPALVVMFGPFAPGEVVVQLMRGDVRAAARRLGRGGAAARLGGRAFHVQYPAPRQVARSFEPWFRLERVRGIGIFVPPSAAEPAISRLPGLLRALEMMDTIAAAPLALLGDHVLLHFRRTATGCER